MRLPYQQAFDFNKKEPFNSCKQDVPIDTYFPEESANKLSSISFACLEELPEETSFRNYYGHPKIP